MDAAEFYLEDLKSKFAKIDPEKYYLSYSGGRDSHFLYWFIKDILHEDRIEIVAINTRMEFPEISNRMIKNADVILIPKMKPHEVIQKRIKELSEYKAPNDHLKNALIQEFQEIIKEIEGVEKE